MNKTTETVIGSPQQPGIVQADMSRHGLSICFLSSKHPPRDKRVFDKEAVTLAQAGFDVIHFAPDNVREDQVEQGVRIITYRPPQGIVGRILQIPRLYRAASRLDADCYHCNEVDSWLVGALLKIVRRKKVVFDVHEHYPSTFAESRFPKWSHTLVAGIIRLVFRLLVIFTDRLVFAKRSVVSDFRGSESKHLLVQNFTSLAVEEHEPSHPEEHTRDSHGRVTAIHLGLFSRVRGWPQLLKALQLLNADNLDLTIIGTFNDGSKADFDAEAASLGLSNRITTIDWLRFEEAYRYIQASDIGLVLFQPGIQNHVYALPHKMFDYMLARLPVIAPAFAEEVAAIIKESDCGVLVDPSDPADIARGLGRLVADAAERQRLGDNGRRAVLARYNWEAEAAKLITMYKEMATSVRSKA